MKKILHSGKFLDYDGNTITVSFYTQTHLWVSRSSITALHTGGTYAVEVWSDAGDAEIFNSPYDWIEPIQTGSYINSDGYRVYQYNIIVSGTPVAGNIKTGTLNVGVDGGVGDYNKTITITRR